MATLLGTLSAQFTLRFIPEDNTSQLIKGVDYSTITDENGDYNITIADGIYTVEIGKRIYKNVNINANGPLNNFLENANGSNV